MNNEKVSTIGNATNLADILERVLDKGLVVAGDINVNIAEIELISIRIRLVICSVDRAKDMGINWWENDSFLSSTTANQNLLKENQLLKERLDLLEKQIKSK